jgi:hypothetical protein
MSAPPPLHQAGFVERVAAVFALAAAREQFICCEPLADDLRVREHRSDGFDWNMVFVVDGQAAEQADGGRGDAVPVVISAPFQDH